MGDEQRRPDRPFVVETRPARESGRSRLPVAAFAVVVAAIVGLAGWGLLVAPGTPPSPAPPSAPVAVASDDAKPAPSREPRSWPTLTGTGNGIEHLVVPTQEDALAALGDLGGWGQCPMWRDLPDGGTITGDAVAAAVRVSGRTFADGMFRVVDTRGAPQLVWLGGGVDDAVRGFGGTLSVRVDGDETPWTGIPVGGYWQAIHLDSVDAEGRPAWYVGARASAAPYCGGARGGPPGEVVEAAPGQDPLTLLFAKVGWNVCRTWQRMELGTAPDPVDLDRAADAAGLPVDDHGFVTVDLPGDLPRTTPVWVGADAGLAVAQHGAQLAVLEPEAAGSRRAWIASWLDGPYAAPFEVVTTPAGRTAWLPLAGGAGVTGSCELDGVQVGAGGAAPGGSADDTRAVVELLPDPGPLSVIMGRAGWDGCQLTTRSASLIVPDGAAIDEAAQRAGVAGWVGTGWLELAGPVGRVWVGEDVVALARAANRPFVAFDETVPAAWLADSTIADEWNVLVTPQGRSAWWPTGSSEWPDRCPARPSTDPLPLPAGIRSVTCWVERARCVEAVSGALGIAPEAFGSDTDIAVGQPEPCPPATRCTSVPTEPVVVVARPAAYTSLDQVRAFSVGQRKLSGVGREIPRAEWTPTELALAARPSLRLTTGTVSDPARECPAAGIEGVLAGSPWDPRIAWVGPNSVMWQMGSSARFVPDLELVDPFGSVARAGDTVQVAGTASMEGGFFACRVTVTGASPVPSAP